MNTIMIVDDEKNIRDSLAGVLNDEGYSVVLAETAEQSLKLLEKSVPDLILLDIWLPGMDGVEALKAHKQQNPNVPVIMISGHATVETAVTATKLGAYDFLEKPLSLDKVVLSVEHALEQKRLTEVNIELQKRVRGECEILGNSPKIKQLRDDIKRVGEANSWALITGANGTGKELVARNLHFYSKRSDKPFIAVNCAAIPEELIESELFGYEKGAFTGANTSKKGRFDMADGGILFLDEIGDMSLKTQAKILRILEEESFERVGGTRTITVDVRVVAATNKDLMEEIRQKNFREDLYYRLNVIPFHVPKLSERGDDILLFVDHFLGVFSRESGREAPTMDADVRKTLLCYGWPGNVRELKNLMERLVIMSRSGRVTTDNLPQYITGAVSRQPKGLFAGSIKEARNDFEKEFILTRLEQYDGNIAKTAEAIGLERSHLYRKVKSYGIKG